MGIAAIPVAITAAAAIASAAAAGVAAKAQANAASYNAKMQQYNATIQKQQGAADAASILMQGEATRGAARARAAASGVDVSGSFMDVDYNSLVNNEQNALNVKYRGDIGAYNSNAQSTLDASQSSSATFGGGVGVAGTLLSGGSQVYTAYNNSYGPRQVQPVTF